MTKPAYGDIKCEDVPEIEKDGVKIRIISGEYNGTKGAFEGKYVKATYFDVALEANKEWSFVTNPENTLFIYMFYGQATFNPSDQNELYDAKQAILFNKGEKFWIKAHDTDVRFILLSARPLKQPIAWGGPIVMNTKEELDLAFEELSNGTFIKHR